MSATYDNLRKNDRILVLEKMEGVDTKSSTGLVDTRLFNGNNKLHCSFDEQTQLWGFSFEKGGLAEEMKQRFTSFPKAHDFAKNYFAKRGIKVTSVVD